MKKSKEGYEIHSVMKGVIVQLIFLKGWAVKIYFFFGFGTSEAFYF